MADDSLEERVAKLERRLEAREGCCTSREFRLVNDAGRLMAALKSEDHGEELLFYDEEGAVRACLGRLDSGGAELTFFDEAGKRRIELSQTRFEPSISFFDEYENLIWTWPRGG